MKYKFLFIIFALLSILARAANVVTLPTVNGSPGDEVTLSISLDNTDAVSAMQLHIPITGDISVVAGSETLGSRATDHSATVGINGGTLVVMVWSMNFTPFTGSSGEVLSFRILLGNEPGSVDLVANKVTLTDTDGNTLDASATSGSVTISAPKAQLATRDIDYGHIPIRDVYHRSLQVTNVGTAPLVISGIEPSASEFSSETVFLYVIEAGNTGTVDITYSPVERGAIEETIRLLSNNIAGTNTIRIVADPFAVNELHVENASGIADSTVTIPLRVNNMDAISGFQFEFDLPEQLQYVDGSFTLSNRKADHQLVVTCMGQHLTAIAYTMGSGTFSGEDGVIATFDVLLSGRYGTELRASKAKLTATYKGVDMDVLSDHYGGWIDIASPQLNATDQLDLGATPVTENAEGTVTVYNGGGAPLRIDRVVFDAEGFSISEACPLVIEPWSSIDLHVTFIGQEEVPFEALMQLYSNDPDHRLHNITVTGSRFAPNYLFFTADDAYQGDDVLVHLNMSNYDPINGIQFDLDYPANCVEAPAEFEPTERAQGFTMMWRDLSGGKARLFIYSLTDNVIATGEGEIATLRFAMKQDVALGQYSFSATEISMGVANLTDKYAGTDQECAFEVIEKTGLPGDANDDGRVDVNDVTTTINYILGKNPSPFNFANADVNNSGDVNVMDVTLIINIILGIE
ncbi:MAG: choice-of-anchor D domain-containing protein [Muribaculaceae bacterium]|nr:choice-of-anchor D domain-containing protein [Muribaculaceae bacterium]